MVITIVPLTLRWTTATPAEIISLSLSLLGIEQSVTPVIQNYNLKIQTKPNKKNKTNKIKLTRERVKQSSFWVLNSTCCCFFESLFLHYLMVLTNIT